MKKIELFGKKVPIIAIIMAVLVIGTASAALFYNYATLRGDIEVTNAISVSDYDTDPIEIGGDGELIFSSPATFVVNNDGNEPVIVDLVTTLYLEDVLVTDEEGLTVDYSVLDGTGVEEGLVLVPPGGLTIDVEFDAVDNAIPGTYTVQVEVNYSAEDYESFTGANALIDVDLTHKNATYVPLGDISELSYAPMGNEFYYELNTVGLETDVSYSLIYYADEVYEESDMPLPDGKNLGDDKWGGINGDAGTVIEILGLVDGSTIASHIDVDMDMPCIPDENFDEGAKVWVIPTSNLTGSNALPMVTWHQSEYLFEYSEILDLDYTDLVRYTDTDA